MTKCNRNPTPKTTPPQKKIPRYAFLRALCLVDWYSVVQTQFGSRADHQ